MNANELESTYPHLTVITDPTEAHLVFDSVSGECVRFNGWMQRSDGYQVAIETLTETKTVTIPQFLAPSNRFYFVQSESYAKYQ